MGTGFGMTVLVMMIGQCKYTLKNETDSSYIPYIIYIICIFLTFITLAHPKNIMGNNAYYKKMKMLYVKFVSIPNLPMPVITKTKTVAIKAYYETSISKLIFKHFRNFDPSIKILTSHTILKQQNIDLHYVNPNDIFVLRRYIYSFGLCVTLILYSSKAFVTVNINSYVLSAYHYVHIYLTTIISILTIINTLFFCIISSQRKLYNFLILYFPILIEFVVFLRAVYNLQSSEILIFWYHNKLLYQNE